MNILIEAIYDLEMHGKEVLAITEDFVLCYWTEDKSYVHWRWSFDSNRRVVLLNGDYNKDKVMANMSFNERLRS